MNKLERSTGVYSDVLYCIAPLGHLLSLESKGFRLYASVLAYTVSSTIFLLWKCNFKIVVNLLDQNIFFLLSSLHLVSD